MQIRPNKYPNFFKIKDAVYSRQISCVDITKYFLERIKTYDKRINAFIEVFEHDAIERSKLIDLKISKGTQGKLAGLVIGIKDNICIAAKETTASSKMLQGFISPQNATVIDKLLEEDAIIIGRLNCDEFGMGSSNENSYYGPVRNPLDENKVPGGSSGGPAASVAAGFCMAALGTDTGGSIRQPASFCGLVGLKPTYGSISRYGCIAYASSLDQIGVLTNSIEDCQLIFNVISGFDSNDSTSLELYDQTKTNSSDYSVAYIKESIENKYVNHKIKNLFEKFLSTLEAKPHIQLNPIQLNLSYLPAVYYTITSAEAATNLQRYSGVHFGYNAEGDSYKEIVERSRTEGFGKEPKKRILIGNYILAKMNNNQLLGKAQKLRNKLCYDLEQIFNEHDFIVTPTTFEAAFELNSKSNNPEGQYFQDVFLVMANLAGIPGVSLPVFENDDSMPFGLHIMSSKMDEANLFDFSKQLMEELAN